MTASQTVPARAFGTPTINFPLRLQNFYAARGMWGSGEPRGWLWTILGPRMNPGCTWHYISAENIRELMRDLTENGRRGLSAQVLGQYLRRMREALKRAGETVAAPVTYRVVTAADGRQYLVKNQPNAAPSAPAAYPARAFDPLLIPTRGKAKAAFEKHVFDCVRAIVDFQQTSEYAAETNHV